MKHPALRRNAIAALCACWPLAAAAADAANPINTVVVSATRADSTSFDLPAAIDVVDAAQIGNTQPRINASEALAAVPGLLVRDRQNYAQDLQISSRGFGARSAFGVRGVRLVADGIPATMPDGQGQAATFNLDVAQRIEVLRGPYSVMYGNHAGGVIQLFTREPQGRPSIEANVSAGSDGLRKTDVNAQGRSGGIGYLVDASRFETDGYRDHSAATREQAYAKLVVTPSTASRLVLTASALRQDDTQDPLGVTWATYQRDPRAGEIDPADTATPKRTFAERYDTRKSIHHTQAGLAWERRFGPDRLLVTAHGGNRRVIQYQSFSRAFQAPATHSGGVIDFDREFHGIDVNWRAVRALAGGSLRATAGIELARSRDVRQGFENFIGATFGVKGGLRRDERNDVTGVDPYAQLEWERGRWVVSGGVRRNRVTFDVQDRYLSNGDDSGSVRFQRATPLAGVLYRLTPALHVYASAARGFETPTLNEVFYSGTGGGFNFALAPALGTHLETGVKSMPASGVRVDAAVFQVRTRDELVVDNSSGGRTSYRNASATLRQGGEASLDADLGAGWNARAALTVLKAVYDEGFGAVPKGSRMPGIPKASFHGEVGWKASAGGFGAALETVANSRVFADDANTATPAPGHALVNLRVQASQQLGGWRLRQFARVNNLLDRGYIGSVIVGETNRRFYEAAPGRNWIVGVSAGYQLPD